MNPTKDGAALLRAVADKPRLTPIEATSYLLTKHGLRYAVGTLAKLRTLGGGPAFRKPSKAILYDITELDRWAAEKLGRPMSSTSDVGAVR